MINQTEVVKELERLTQLAKDGKLRGFAMVGVVEDVSQIRVERSVRIFAPGDFERLYIGVDVMKDGFMDRIKLG